MSTHSTKLEELNDALLLTGCPLKRRKTVSSRNDVTAIKNSKFENVEEAVNGQNTVNREFIKFVKGKFHNIRGDCDILGSDATDSGAAAAGVPKKRMMKLSLKDNDMSNPIQ